MIIMMSVYDYVIGSGKWPMQYKQLKKRHSYIIVYICPISNCRNFDLL